MAIKNKVKGFEHIEIPEYFYYDNRYQSVSRYPVEGKGLFVPWNMIDDLDECFHRLLVLVPFQFNSLLVSTLSPSNDRQKKKLNTLQRDNRQMCNIRNFLKNWVKT